MKRLLAGIITFLTISIPTFAQTTEEIANDPTFYGSIIGICARTIDGQSLIEINSEKMLVPASNMKLISTGAALNAFGPDFCYETSIAYDGEISDGILHGNLYIVGGGDPTIASKDSIATPLERTFEQWAKFVKDAGIQQINGYIIGDGRYFDGMAEEPTWLWNDIGTYYGTGTTGLMFYENMQSFSVSAGSSVGAPVNIRPYYPETPWMDFRYACATGEKGTGDKLYMYTSDLAPIAEIRGTFGVDRAAKRVDWSNKFPEYTCAYYFCNYLSEKGITCSEGAADYKLNKVEASEERTVLGSTYSPKLERIIFETNHASNNLFAETLFRTLGKVLNSDSSYESSSAALKGVLNNLGIDTEKGAKIQDGSGLSRQNYISPGFICSFLVAMAETENFCTYILSLPIPGGNGTLEYNMKGHPLSLRNRIRVKSGSMNGVRCYSGYILPSGYTLETLVNEQLTEEVKNKTIVFSIMTNNCTAPTWKVRPMLDKVMADLALYN